MIRHSSAVALALVGAVVFTGSTPAQAANQTEITRAIVVTVLNNLGVQPTAQLIDDIVSEIPAGILDSALVQQVGQALDSSGDPTLIIGQTVDTDGDGIPNAGATDDDDDSGDSASDSSGSSGGTSSGTGGNSGSGTSPKPNSEDDNDSDNNPDDGDGDGEEESGDDEDN